MVIPAISNHNVLADVEHELNKARDKFPNNRHMMNALSEEHGELAKALIQQDNEPEKGVTHEDIYWEAIQTAVMAIRVATEGDSTLPKYHPESGYRGKGWKAINLPARNVAVEVGTSSTRWGATDNTLARNVQMTDKELKPKIVCHAEGDRCHGCDHYHGKSPLCEFARHPAPDSVLGHDEMETCHLCKGEGLVMAGRNHVSELFERAWTKKMSQRSRFAARLDASCTGLPDEESPASSDSVPRELVEMARGLLFRARSCYLTNSKSDREWESDREAFEEHYSKLGGREVSKTPEEKRLGTIRDVLHNACVSPELEDVINSDLYSELESVIEQVAEAIATDSEAQIAALVEALRDAHVKSAGLLLLAGDLEISRKKLRERAESLLEATSAALKAAGAE